MKKKVLIFTGFYTPGVKGGGPIQSIKNLVDNLSDKIDFYIVTADRDLGDDKPFDSIRVDEWVTVGAANVWYTDSANLSWKKTSSIMKKIEYDFIYLNSFFSFKFSIVPLLLNKFNKSYSKPIVLAPRGQFSPGALALKSKKKKLYIEISKALGLYKNIVWHATADTEKNDIEKTFNNNVEVLVANNLTANYKKLEFGKMIEKKSGEIKIVFISRIHPKKNLKKAIEFLRNLEGQISFNIYGPIEDKTYWRECEKMISKLPKQVTVNYKGLVKHEDIFEILNSHHIFLFPTLGENFGHVISEALIGGCPVIISDQTPWKELEKKEVGWDIDLKNEKRFIEVLQYCTSMDQQKYNIFSRNAFNYGLQKSNQQKDIDDTIDLFI